MQVNLSMHMDRQLENNLKNLPFMVQRKVKAELIETALVDIETEAKMNCRVYTGRLRASIHTIYKGHNQSYRYSDSNGNSYTSNFYNEMNPGFWDVFVGTDVVYANHIERHYPYLIPAFMKAKPALERRIKAIFRNI